MVITRLDSNDVDRIETRMKEKEEEKATGKDGMELRFLECKQFREHMIEKRSGKTRGEDR